MAENSQKYYNKAAKIQNVIAETLTWTWLWVQLIFLFLSFIPPYGEGLL
jgi:hypothetical protein